MKKIILTITLFIFIALSGFLSLRLFMVTRAHSNMEKSASMSASPAETGGTLKAGMIDPKTGKKIKYWAAPMDPTYIRNEPGKSPMGMDLVPVYEEAGEEQESASTIRIDPVTIQNMGVRLAKVDQKPMVKHIRTFGTIAYDESRMYTVNTKFSGWIEKLHVDFVGEQVMKGQPLFDIYSPELVTAQEEFLLARAHYESLSGSPYDHLGESARRLLDAAETRLRYWDLTEKQIRRLGQRGVPEKTVTIHTPASGVVTRKQAFEGHYVKTGEHQFEIADLTKVWVDVDIYEYELPWIKAGMPADMELSYIPGKRFQGKVIFIYPYLSPKTRTATLRLEYDNTSHQLKPGMYANIYLKSEIAAKGTVIPQTAVIDSGMRKVVFVWEGKGKFSPREVKLGIEVNGREFQVLEGVQPGEEIVVSAQFMLDSESRLKEAIQKMLAIRDQERATGRGFDPKSEDDKAMDDDLDMSGLDMEEM